MVDNTKVDDPRTDEQTPSPSAGWRIVEAVMVGENGRERPETTISVLTEGRIEEEWRRASRPGVIIHA